MQELLLARSFIAARGARRPHASYLVSALAVALGTSFLVLTLGVYDSYVQKLETITWSVYPHLLVFERPAKGQGGAPAAPIAPTVDGDLCRRICRGDPLGPEPGAGRPIDLPAIDRLSEIQVELSEAGLAGRAAPLILEEKDLLCRFRAGAGEVIEMRNLRILGIETAAGRLVPEVDLFVPRELVARLGQGPGVILSRELARSMFGDAEASGETLSVRRPGAEPLDLTVEGTFSLGFHTISRNMLVASLATAQELLGVDGRASYFGVALEDPYASGAAVEKLRRPLRRRSLSVSDWTKIAAGDFSNIQLFRWILIVVLGLSFVITGLSIRNTLAIITVERRRQIGILRALGLRNASIRRIFLAIALSIGLAGAVPGLFAGSLSSLYFGHWLDQALSDVLPVHGVEMSLQPAAMAQVLVLVLLSCAVTALLSVGRALELDPVTCLIAE